MGIKNQLLILPEEEGLPLFSGVPQRVDLPPFKPPEFVPQLPLLAEARILLNGKLPPQPAKYRRKKRR